MVNCTIYRCQARSDREKDLSFSRVPNVLKNKGEKMEELSIERRTKWISAISRENLSDSILQNQRVCGRHFVSGKAAKD